MPTPTTVSIALASCNGARFIDEQLESLALQTRPPDELIVSDDASNDDTCQRVEAFARRADFPVHLIQNETRAATTVNFQRALEQCTGEVIFFSDQDDFWRPRKIERMVDHFDRQPETGALLCNASVVDEQRTPLGYDIWRAMGFGESEQKMVREGNAPLVFFKHVVAAGNTLAFRGRYKPLIMPIPDLRSIHDAWVAFLLASVSDFEILDEDLVEYRLHDSNQFGLGLLSLRTQYQKARLQVRERAFRHAVRFFSAVLERIDAQTEYRLEPALRQQVEEKIEHSRIRDEMSKNPFRRLPSVLREMARGHYRLYGYGYKSIAQDLFLR